jgi:hypothetical protein
MCIEASLWNKNNIIFIILFLFFFDTMVLKNILCCGGNIGVISLIGDFF